MHADEVVAAIVSVVLALVISNTVKIAKLEQQLKALYRYVRKIKRYVYRTYQRVNNERLCPRQ